MVKKNNSIKQRKASCQIKEKDYLKLADKKILETKRRVDKIEEKVLEIHNKMSFLL